VLNVWTTHQMQCRSTEIRDLPNVPFAVVDMEFDALLQSAVDHSGIEWDLVANHGSLRPHDDESGCGT